MRSHQEYTMSRIQRIPVNPGSDPCESLDRFAQEAERSLSAFYSYVRQHQGERAAYSIAEGWLEVFEKRLVESDSLPNIPEVTATAIAVLAARARPEFQAMSAQARE